MFFCIANLALKLHYISIYIIFVLYMFSFYCGCESIFLKLWLYIIIFFATLKASIQGWLLSLSSEFEVQLS